VPSFEKSISSILATIDRSMFKAAKRRVREKWLYRTIISCHVASANGMLQIIRLHRAIEAPSEIAETRVLLADKRRQRSKVSARVGEAIKMGKTTQEFAIHEESRRCRRAVR